MNGYYKAAGRIFRPWKNGGGQTAEIAVSPAGADFAGFDWRISTAIVASDGPFSLFPDVDRVLAVLEGGPMRLDIAGQSHVLTADSLALAFPGDVPSAAELTEGPILDFNVMTRRPLKAEVTRGPFSPPAGPAPAGPAPARPAIARLALLLEQGGGLERLDLVDLDACDPALLLSLKGLQTLMVTITDPASVTLSGQR